MLVRRKKEERKKEEGKRKERRRKEDFGKFMIIYIQETGFLSRYLATQPRFYEKPGF